MSADRTLQLMLTLVDNPYATGLDSKMGIACGMVDSPIPFAIKFQV